jgi:predicted GIY-YIG superfamily endonuclease
MYYVYLLRSQLSPDKTYVGFTKDLKNRLTAHNNGQSPHTAKFKPWELISYTAFQDRKKAINFEKYLKSHSGKAFANKRLW